MHMKWSGIFQTSEILEGNAFSFTYNGPQAQNKIEKKMSASKMKWNETNESGRKAR